MGGPPSSPYITHIETNIKDLGASFEFDRAHVFVAGYNGTGKTALFNAIELALIGEAFDFAGRDGVRSSSLLKGLLPQGAPILYSKLKFSDGSEASWILEPGHKPVHKPPPFPVTMPLREALNALTGSKAVAMRFLMRNYGPFKSITNDTPELWGIYNDQFTDMFYRDRLLAVEAKARKNVSAHKKQVTACKNGLEALKANEDLALTQKAEVVHAIRSLTAFQLDKKLSTCGICGQQVDEDTLRDRNFVANEKSLSLPQVSVDVVAGLVAAREVAQRRVDQHQAVVDRIMRRLEAWTRWYAPKFERKLADSPIGPIGLQITGSYVLIGRKQNNGTIWPVISGAENIILATTMAALARRASNLQDKGISVLIAPDRAFDPVMLRKLLNLAGGIDANIFIQSTLTPRGRPPKEWSRVVLNTLET